MKHSKETEPQSVREKVDSTVAMGFDAIRGAIIKETVASASGEQSYSTYIGLIGNKGPSCRR